jgi:hypothetical protein
MMLDLAYGQAIAQSSRAAGRKCRGSNGGSGSLAWQSSRNPRIHRANAMDGKGSFGARRNRYRRRRCRASGKGRIVLCASSQKRHQKRSSQAVGIHNLKILSVPSMPVHFTRATHPQPAAIVVLSELVLKC